MPVGHAMVRSQARTRNSSCCRCSVGLVQTAPLCALPEGCRALCHGRGLALRTEEPWGSAMGWCWCHDPPPIERQERGANAAAFMDLQTTRKAWMPPTARRAAASDPPPPPPRAGVGGMPRGWSIARGHRDDRPPLSPRKANVPLGRWGQPRRRMHHPEVLTGTLPQP